MLTGCTGNVTLRNDALVPRFGQYVEITLLIGWLSSSITSARRMSRVGVAVSLMPVIICASLVVKFVAHCPPITAGTTCGPGTQRPSWSLVSFGLPEKMCAQCRCALSNTSMLWSYWRIRGKIIRTGCAVLCDTIMHRHMHTDVSSSYRYLGLWLRFTVWFFHFFARVCLFGART